MSELGPPVDGDDDGQVADEHHKDGQDPGEGDEVSKIEQFMLLVGDGDGVHALPVGSDDGVGLETEDDGLWDGAEHGHGPGHHQQPPGAVDRRPVGDREHYGTEPEVRTIC